MRVALLPHGMQEWNLRVCVSHSRPLISRRRVVVAGLSVVSPSAAVSTHTWGPPYPRAARTLSLTHLLTCLTFIALAVYPADSGEASDKALPIAWRRGGQSNPLSLDVLHSTLSFAMPRVGLATPVDLDRRAVTYWTQSLPKVMLGVDGGRSCVGKSEGAGYARNQWHKDRGHVLVMRKVGGVPWRVRARAPATPRVDTDIQG